MDEERVLTDLLGPCRLTTVPEMERHLSFRQRRQSRFKCSEDRRPCQNRNLNVAKRAKAQRAKIADLPGTLRYTEP
uniref:Uncharacterized protein n=1 Tax=Bionectria ochroleuca TaxID=29856 RepID=A0A0B7JLR9_BIOOC